MSDFVLDASVSLALYLPATSVQQDYAIKILRLLKNGAIPAVPSLWVQEVSSRLIIARRSRQITLEIYKQAISELDRLNYDPHHIAYSLSDLTSAAKMYNLQGYDAVYFDLARRNNIPIASLDKGIKTACVSHGVKLL